MAELDVTRKPVPSPKPEAMPFWDGLREGEIRLQRCDECRRVQFYPRPHCRYCGSLALTWEALSGEASVYSYTVIHRAPFAAFADDVPYALAVVELAGGPAATTTSSRTIRGRSRSAWHSLRSSTRSPTTSPSSASGRHDLRPSAPSSPTSPIRARAR